MKKTKGVDPEEWAVSRFVLFCKGLKEQGEIHGIYDGPSIPGSDLHKSAVYRDLVNMFPDLEDQIKWNSDVPLGLPPESGVRRSLGQSVQIVHGLRDMGKRLDRIDALRGRGCERSGGSIDDEEIVEGVIVSNWPELKSGK